MRTADASTQSPRVRVRRVRATKFFSAHETCTCTSTVEQYIYMHQHQISFWCVAMIAIGVGGATPSRQIPAHAPVDINSITRMPVSPSAGNVRFLTA